jgi:hypothetical protein
MNVENGIQSPNFWQADSKLDADQRFNSQKIIRISKTIFHENAEL